MNANKALWEKGDFTRIAECMRENGVDIPDPQTGGDGEGVFVKFTCPIDGRLIPPAAVGKDAIEGAIQRGTADGQLDRGRGRAVP